MALFTDRLPNRSPFIVGQIVHIERQTARQAPPSSSSEPNRDSDTGALNTGGSSASSNPYGLPIGCEYFVVTVAMLPDTKIHSPPPS